MTQRNRSKVKRDGLRLLGIRSAKLRRLRNDIDLGLADIDAGRTKPLTDALLRDIADRGQERQVTREIKT